MISRASFGIVLSIGAVLLFAIWPNIFPLQQHVAVAEIVPGSAPANTTATGAPANPTGAPANTTTAAGAPANRTGAEAPEAGDPAGEEVVPHWYGGAPCPDNSCHD